MKTCSKCGNTVANDALFCDKCGTQIKDDQKKVCSVCGCEMDASFKFCAKCGASQSASNPAVTVGLQKIKINNKQFVIIALCAAILLSLLLLPIFELQSGYIDTKNRFVKEDSYTFQIVGENYFPDKDFEETASTIAPTSFIIILVTLCAVSYFTLTKQKKYSLVSACANLVLIGLFEVIVISAWSDTGGKVHHATQAVMGAGGLISIVLALVLVLYIFNENIFKQVIQKAKRLAKKVRGIS